MPSVALSPMFSTYSIGFSLRNMKPRTRFLSSGVISISRSGRSVSRCALARNSSSCSRSISSDFIFLQVLLDALQPLLHLAEVVDDEVEVDVLDVAQGIDWPDVRNGVVFEGAHHVRQRVDIAQVGGEGSLVQRFFRQRGHVGVFHARMDEFLRVVEGGQAVEAVVGNFGHAEVRLARIAMRALRHLLLRKHDEQRCFAYQRQADDAGFHKKQLAISN